MAKKKLEDVEDVVIDAPAFVGGIPVGRTTESRIPDEPVYPDSAFSGLYFCEKDGEHYALCIHEPDGYQRTHTAKNTVHFWQGTKTEFRALFEKA